MRHARHRRVRDFVIDSELLIDRYEKSTCCCEKELPVIPWVNDDSQELLSYMTYHLADKSSQYVDEVARSVEN